jgi:hypothetical protein
MTGRPSSATRSSCPLVRDGAIAAAAHGWPVTPGTFLHPVRELTVWYGRPRASRLCPATDGWRQNRITDPDRAGQLWKHRPYSVLLVCGFGVDALVVPPEVAEIALPAVGGAGLAGPIAAVPDPWRWLLFVESGAPLHPALRAVGVELRARDQWAPLPPTHLGSTRARWHHLPEGWQPPGSAPAQDAISRALEAGCDADLARC